MRDSATGEREAGDLLLQEIPDGFEAFRVVQANPPGEVDFQSHYERGLVPGLSRPFRGFEVLGVSTFADRDRAQRLVKSAERRGERAWLARLTFRADTGLWGLYNARTTHLEVFGLPQDLLARVEEIL